MSLSTQIQSLVTAIATDVNTLYGKQGDLSSLSTAQKTTLVGAINELQNAIASGGGAAINDTTPSTTSVYSSSKTEDRLTSALAGLKNEILGGAGAAYDTLKELQDLFTGSSSQVNDLLTAVGNRVRTDVNNQGLTEPQKANARTNIDVYSKAEIGNPDTDLVAAYNAARA